MRHIPLLLLVLAPATSQGFELCGVEAGKTASALQVRKAMNVRCNAGLRGLTVCNGTARLADRTATANVVLDKDDVVQRIRLHPELNHYDMVVVHLQRKYGPPSSTVRSPIRSPDGFPEVQERLTWSGGTSQELILLKFSNQRGRSLLYVGNAADRALIGQRLE